MKKFFSTVLVALLSLPAWASAQAPNFRVDVYGSNAPTDFRSLVSLFITIINSLLVLLVGLSLLVFFKGLVGFIAKAGDAKSHADGRNLMVWGLIGLFVMVSVFGILRFFYSDLGFRNPNNPGSLLPLLPQQR